MEIGNRLMSDIVVNMKYARYLPDKQRRETWDEIVERNKQMHLTNFPQIKEVIEQVYEEGVRPKKVLPSMRSLQFAGEAIDVNPIRMFNCSALKVDKPDAFWETMLLLLSGTGVGFSVQKHHVEHLPTVKPVNKDRRKRYLINDSVEGWADAVRMLMESYFYGKREVDFDYRAIRPKGTMLVTSGGKAPGPEPLRVAVDKIRGVLENVVADRGETQLRPIEIHDIMCHIADAVLAGGIRRSAMISLFSADDYEMMGAKAGAWWELNPQRGRANNTVVLERDKVTQEQFLALWERVKASGSGEPGFMFTSDTDWLLNPSKRAA